MRRQLLPALRTAVIGLPFAANTLSASASGLNSSPSGPVYAPNRTVTSFETLPAADCPVIASESSSPCTVEVIASVYEIPAPAG